MAIPITCGGCGAAFEVPDNLAGKTIRCTACKAQMSVSVPEEVPVAVEEAAEAKKPFGAGVKTAPKAASSTPTASAKSHSDEPTPAKTSAKVEAKPTAKPTAKPAAKDKDEDEDEPSEKKNKKDRPTAKAAPKKRRDDDDDDDDDDVDDRPRRSKRKREGGPSYILIFGGGFLGLMALGGLIATIASMGGDSKKHDNKPAETAKNDTTTPPPQANPNPQPAPNPGTNPAPQPGGGVTVTNPGQTPQPGTGPNPNPQPGTGPGPNPNPNPTPAPGPGGGFLPNAGDVGGGGQNLPIDANSPLQALGKREKFGTPGMWANHSGDGFGAEFPGTPETLSDSIQMPSPAPGSPPLGKVKLEFTLLTKDRNGGCLAMAFHFPFDFEQVPGASQMLLQKMTEAFSKDKKLRPVGPATDVESDGVAGKELELSGESGKGTMRIFLVKNRVYIFLGGGNNANDQADGKRFVTSAKISYKGGDQVVTLPTGGNPGTGPNPGGVPPSPGIPADTNGNQKTRLDVFVALSFDTENNEVITIEPAGGKTNTSTLHRWKYPEFTSIATYKLGHIGFRSAIDSKAGLLYVANTSNGNSIRGVRTERVSGVGSIAVYDLKAIRDGKAADGKDGVLKPAKTLQLNQRIHAIELSNDGKNLYVLMTATGSNVPAPSLVRYAIEGDKFTEDNRVKSKQLNDDHPVLDMVRSADGESVYIIGDYVPKAKTSQVIHFDLTKWTKLKTNTFTNSGVIDVAPMKDGWALVSVTSLDKHGGGGGNVPGPAVPPGGGIAPPVGVPPGGPGKPPGAPPGGLPGQPPVGQPSQPQYDFHFVLLDNNGVEKSEIDLGTAHHLTNCAYAKYDPDNKKLFVSSWQGPSGMDMYEVTDSTSASGLKLKTAIRSTQQRDFKGHFFMSPDGKYVVFQDGPVIETSNVGGSLATPGTPGIPGIPGNPNPQPGMPPVTPVPGMPPVTTVPGQPPVQGGNPVPQPAPGAPPVTPVPAPGQPPMQGNPGMPPMTVTNPGTPQPQPQPAPGTPPMTVTNPGTPPVQGGQPGNPGAPPPMTVTNPGQPAPPKPNK